MLTMLKSWPGSVEINGVMYANISEALKNAEISDFSAVSIRLHSTAKQRQTERKTVSQSISNEIQQYRVSVKKWMTEKSTPGFDWMKKVNNDNPMPFRTMIGTVEKETRGMYYMKLHADIYARTIPTCMKCGRPLTNRISQFFGVGPECGGHNYVNPFNSDEELNEAVAQYRAKLQNITWEGYIAKSAILEWEEN